MPESKGGNVDEWLRHRTTTLEELGQWAIRFSPRVALDPPDGLLFDVGGSERLFGGEEKLAGAIVDAFEKLGFRARAAVASTIGCAWAVARYRQLVSVPLGGERNALAPLSIEALRLEPETVEGLVELGIETVAHLYELERDDLPARFGGELLLRLDQALGAALEPLEPLRPTFPPCAAFELEAPVELQATIAELERLLGELTEELERRGEGALRLECELQCAQAPPVREVVMLSRPNRDFAHLRSLLLPRIERAQLGFGVERVELRAPLTAAEPGRQVEPWENAERAHERALGELLDTLSGRLGRERILDLDVVESHLPEEAFRARPCQEVARRRTGTPRIAPLARPSRLFTPPDPAAVDADLLRWRGRTCRLVQRFGPERIEPAWWIDGVASARDFFRVEDEDGRWLWLARDASERWFVHGEWS